MPVWERTTVPLPDAILADVTAGEATWLVGYAWTSDGDFAPRATRRVNGAWTGDTAAGLPAPGRLDGIDAAAGRVWAVGTENVHDTAGNLTGFRALAARWDGTAWRRARLPLVQDDHNRATLNRVDVLPDGQVWAAGTCTRLSPDPDTQVTEPTGVVLHFDGTRWERFDVPEGSGHFTDLAVVDGSVWIAAESGFDGAGVWTLHAEPPGHPTGLSGSLRAVAAGQSGTWTVGADFDDQGTYTPVAAGSPRPFESGGSTGPPTFR
ncbi:hypothetical protein [Streptomyces sp. NPDC096339]|uniref:hypothetical protein n=1 Tax=Streptomyces sp. NPDC096339 TaxID=3366086 RepID=UPI00382D18AA